MYFLQVGDYYETLIGSDLLKLERDWRHSISNIIYETRQKKNKYELRKIILFMIRRNLNTNLNQDKLFFFSKLIQSMFK